MLEIVRRFVLLVCLLGAIATALLPKGALLRVATVDMAERQERKPYLAPRDALHSAPPAYLFPYRRYSLWLFLVGVLVYALLPRRKHPPEAIYYSRSYTGVLMDILGCLLAGAFFALPLWIIPANATNANVLSFADGWAWLTLICWALGAGGVILLSWAARYSSFQLLIHPDRLLLTTWRGPEEYPFAEMTTAILAESSVLGGRPERVRKAGQVLAALLFLINWRVSAIVAGLTSQRRQGLEILCRDGRTLRIWPGGLVGLERLEQALRAAGVLMTEEAGALLGGKEVKKRPMSKSRRKKQ